MKKDELLKKLLSFEAPFVVMGVGIPGSGKSTVLAMLSETLGIELISSDGVRKEITGSESDQSRTDEVWNEVYRRAGDLLKRNKSVIIDATHTEVAFRIQSIVNYRGFGAKTIIAIQFNILLEEAKRRNNIRKRVVPEYVLDQMNQFLVENPVRLSDGFDEIIEIDELFSY